jgi:hypothetical protein
MSTTTDSESSSKPNSRTRRTISVDYILDIETENWDRFVMGCLYDVSTGKAYVFDWRREEEFVDFILCCPGVIYGHNAGGFDTLWLLDHLVRRGIRAKVTLVGQRVLSLEYGDTTVKDSYALIPLSLAKGAQIGGVDKLETGLVCNCGQNCGGYCRISRNMGLSEMEQLRIYLERDCLACARMLERLIIYAEDSDLDLCDTIGASSWAFARRLLDLPNARWKVGQYEFARKSYYGGRTEVFKVTSESGHRYDINSAYPAALTQCNLPYGEFAACEGSEARNYFYQDREGIYSIVGQVASDCRIPPLPVRTDARICYPVGTVEGVYTGIELRSAFQSGKFRVTRWGNAMVFTESGLLLRDALLRVWTLRFQCGPSTPLGQWLKWYGNSLTGKLGQRPEKAAIVMGHAEKKVCPARFNCKGKHEKWQPCCIHSCTGKCGRYLPMDIRGRFWIKHSYRISSCAHVHWAAYLTAYARKLLYERIKTDDSVYCDTDSCYSEAPNSTNVGDQLGQWKYEGPYRQFEANAPKAYRYVDPTQGKVQARLKGIPDAEKNYDKALTEGVTINRGVWSLRAALSRDNLFTRKSIHRSVKKPNIWVGDRKLADNGIDTVPVTIDEQLARKR